MHWPSQSKVKHVYGDEILRVLREIFVAVASRLLSPRPLKDLFTLKMGCQNFIENLMQMNETH